MLKVFNLFESVEYPDTDIVIIHHTFQLICGYNAVLGVRLKTKGKILCFLYMKDRDNFIQHFSCTSIAGHGNMQL